MWHRHSCLCFFEGHLLRGCPILCGLDSVDLARLLYCRKGWDLRIRTDDARVTRVEQAFRPAVKLLTLRL